MAQRNVLWAFFNQVEMRKNTVKTGWDENYTYHNDLRASQFGKFIYLFQGPKISSCCLESGMFPLGVVYGVNPEFSLPSILESLLGVRECRLF